MFQTNNKTYDLEERTFKFAKEVGLFSKKECKETIYWLRMLNFEDETIENKRQKLIKEAQELMNIFGAILIKCK